jgi:arylformamidase
MSKTARPAKPTPAWLDRMYNNRALVPDHARHLVQWAEASEDARDAHTCLSNIAYGDGPMETLDVFPAKQPDSPVMVFIHGGYWRSLDKSDHSFIAPAFVNEGACVVVPNYALCPAVTIPDITLQMVKALVWTYRHVAQHGGDPDRITVIGHSAGGHLATMMLSCLWKQVDKSLPADLVKDAMSISGLYDLEPVMKAPFLKESLRLTKEQVQLASPAYFKAPKHGKLYALAGADESAEFIRHNQLIQDAWGKKKVPVCELVPQRNHFSIVEDLTAPWTELHKLAVAMVKAA